MCVFFIFYFSFTFISLSWKQITAIIFLKTLIRCFLNWTKSEQQFLSLFSRVKVKWYVNQIFSIISVWYVGRSQINNYEALWIIRGECDYLLMTTLITMVTFILEEQLFFIALCFYEDMFIIQRYKNEKHDRLVSSFISKRISLSNVDWLSTRGKSFIYDIRTFVANILFLLEHTHSTHSILI